MPDKNNLILVGPMGAGKSAVGRQLALSLSKEFFDSDHSIVERTGVDIAYIFEKESEAGFRKRETQILRELAAKENIVLSTGGGSLVRPENRNIIAQAGTVIYLHATVEQQASRTKKKDNRPLLIAEDPKAVLAQLMLEREKHYREVSDIVINTDGQKVDRVVRKILNKLDEHNSKLNKSVESQHYQVPVNTSSRKYLVHAGYDLLSDRALIEQLLVNPRVVITDENLDSLYRNYLESRLNPDAWLVIPASETSKSIEHYQWLLEQLLELKVTRNTQLIAIGGGVVGDLAGFVSATYMRGMPLIHIPTSLLAMVDSSIGGKTGINFAQGKNLVGSIYQPHKVITDISFIKTLPQHEYVSGLAEVLKYALIHKPDLLSYIEKHVEDIMERDRTVLLKLIAESIKSKAEIVAKDEQDHGLRMLLNFGHTFGHAIEKIQKYQVFSHGQAVAVGICMAADVSKSMGHLTEQELERVIKICGALGLPTQCSGIDSEALVEAMSIDKKNTNQQQRFILMKALGEAYIESNLDSIVLETSIKNYLQ